MRIRFLHNGRRNLFSVWNEYSHSPRPVLVNRAFHAFARGEAMDFPNQFTRSQRLIGWAVDKAAEGCSWLLIRWLAGRTAYDELVRAGAVARVASWSSSTCQSGGT